MRYSISFAVVVLVTGLWGSAAQAQRPWRITLGYDSSRLNSNTSNGFSAVSRQGFLGAYGTEQGAATIGVSYDFFRDTKRGVHLFLYGDLGGLFFTHLYDGAGIGIRKELVDVYGGNLYIGAGVGIYSADLDNGTTPGGKIFLGLQSRGAIFGELGVPFIADQDFRRGGEIRFGARF